MRTSSPPAEKLYSAVTSTRARLIRLGGAEPAARFQAKTEDGEFTLSLPDEAVAQGLGPHIYSILDIVMRVARNEDGEIESGELIEFHPVGSVGATEAWREWFKPHSPYWDTVDDIERDLGRDPVLRRRYQNGNFR